jgi:2-iminoacetate synthase
MDLQQTLEQLDINYLESIVKNATAQDVRNTLNKRYLNIEDFAVLISESASDLLEEIALKARDVNINNFGKSVLLYTPLYIANYCVNKCLYCGYNIENDIKRSKLTLEEIEEEAIGIAKTGLKHILFLTGESKKDTPIEYLVDAVKILKKYFDSISIEIHPLDTEDYKKLVDAGVDGLTVYQEVYDREIYKKVHVKGPKRNYDYRLNTPTRAIEGGVHSINIGCLLGLSDWRTESIYTAIHLDYLMRNYSEIEYGISAPRIRECAGGLDNIDEIQDKDFVKLLMAYRIVFPRVSINLSTRENQTLRDNMLSLGVNKISAGVKTTVGGHTDDAQGDEQFIISDGRSVDEVYASIEEKGYQPIFRDYIRSI